MKAVTHQASMICGCALVVMWLPCGVLVNMPTPVWNTSANQVVHQCLHQSKGVDLPKGKATNSCLYWSDRPATHSGTAGPTFFSLIIDHLQLYPRMVLCCVHSCGPLAGLGHLVPAMSK